MTSKQQELASRLTALAESVDDLIKSGAIYQYLPQIRDSLLYMAEHVADTPEQRRTEASGLAKLFTDDWAFMKTHLCEQIADASDSYRRL